MIGGISVELPVDYVHTQIAFVKTIIERLQLIAKPIIMRASLCLYMNACNFTFNNINSHQANML